MPANLLIGLRSDFPIFSERALKYKMNHVDFDSAIPRFESWRPSQRFQTVIQIVLRPKKIRVSMR
jgi:hypothetical protein